MAPKKRKTQKQQSTQSQTANALASLNPAILISNPSLEETKEEPQLQQYSGATELRSAVDEQEASDSDMKNALTNSIAPI